MTAGARLHSFLYTTELCVAGQAPATAPGGLAISGRHAYDSIVERYRESKWLLFRDFIAAPSSARQRLLGTFPHSMHMQLGRLSMVPHPDQQIAWGRSPLTPSLLLTPPTARSPSREMPFSGL